MHSKKLVLALCVVTIFLGVTTSSAEAYVDTWPSCGEKVITTSGGGFSHPNFTLEEKYDSNYPWNPYFFYFSSFNGWRIYEIYMEFSPGSPVQHGIFPDGKTTLTLWSTEKASHIEVTLKKDCNYTPGCRSTDTYVFTLLGNYPCNLISGEKEIPPRFKNPVYFNPLCALSDREFEWNGKWVVNTVKICNGYEVGGNYYDTRLEELNYKISR